jgi:hypothetical protein
MTKTKLVGLVAAAVATYGVWHWHARGDDARDSGDEVDDASAKLALDRLWIDHVPRGETDKINLFVALSEEGVGVFQEASAWQGKYDLFRFEASGNEIRTFYPQTKQRERLSVRARECRDVEHMDYCMDVSGGSHGVKHYYSAKGWEIGDATLPAAIAHADALVQSAR